MYFKLTLLALLLLGWTKVAILFLLVNLIVINFGKMIFAGLRTCCASVERCLKMISKRQHTSASFLPM